MKKKFYIVIAPELGWNNVVETCMAENEEKVWEYLASQNEGDTVEKLKKERFYRVYERKLNDI